MKPVFLFSIKISAVLSLVYSLLYLGNFFNVTYVRLVQGGLVRYSLSKNFVSTSFDPIIWLCLLIVVMLGLAFSFYTNRQEVGHRHLLLIFPAIFVFLAFFPNFTATWLVLASVFVFLLLVVFSRTFFGISSLSLVRTLAIYFIFILLCVGVISFLSSYLLISSLGPNLGLQITEGLSRWIFLNFSLTNLAFPLVPYMYLILIVLGVVGIFIKIVGLKRILESLSLQKLLQNSVSRESQSFHWSLIGRFDLEFVFAISVFVSSLLVVITILPWVNPSYRFVSVDGPIYFNWLSEMRSSSFGGAISLAFAGDRPLSLVFLYFLSSVFSPKDLLQFLPALLIPLLALLSFFIVRLVSSSMESWVYVVLLAPISIQALGLIYSGYFANVLGLILVFLFYIIFLRMVRAGAFLGVLPLVGLSMLLIFTYPWIWFIHALSLGAYLLLQLFFARRNPLLWASFRLKSFLVSISLVVGLVCDLLRSSLVHTSSVGIVYETVKGSLVFPNVFSLLNGFKVTSEFYLGGIFSSFLLVFLSIVGFLFILNSRSDISDLLVCWIFVSSVCILFNSSEFAFHKFLFSMPLTIFSGLGLWIVTRFLSKGGTFRFQKLTRYVIFNFVFLGLLNSAIWYVCNITSVG